MTRLLRFGTLLAGLILIAVLGSLQESDRPETARRERSIEGRVVVSEAAGGAPAPPAPPAATDAMVAAARGDLLTHRPPGVLTGPFKVEAKAAAPDALAELNLTPSQRAIVDALVAERDARHQEIRLATSADPDQRCADAERAQATCMAAIRTTLLPEQQAGFDRLVTSGRWGGYTIVIPRN